MKKIAFLALTAVVALTACSKEDGVNRSEAGEAGAIEFRPVVEKTRASLTDSKDDFKDFFTHAYKEGAVSTFGFFEGVVYSDGAGWTYAPKKYYPADGKKVNFYAYAPVKDKNMTTDVATAAGTVSFGYTVPANQSVSNTAKDLLVSRKVDMTSGTINFAFDHALSAVKFSAKNSNPTTSELVYTISNVEIMNLANAGTFTYDNTGTAATGEWSDNTTYGATYIAGIPAAGIAVSPGGSVAENILSENDFMMVLPQEPALGTVTDGEPTDPSTGALVKVTFSLRDGEGKFIYDNATRYLVLPNSFKFEMGKRYNFLIEFQASEAIVLNVTSLTDWGPATDTVLN